MIRSSIAACLLVVPFVASCALSEEELATDPNAPEEIEVDESAPPATQSLLGESCNNTDIFITNSRTRNGVNTTIEVRSVEYYSVPAGRWYSEDLSNAILNFGQQGIWWDEDLASVRNESISQWRVHYRFVENGAWSNEVYQTINTPDETCVADSNFEMVVD
jgi:hypothetical protein